MAEDGVRSRLPAGRRLGVREWVALPELGITCMQARLAADADASLLVATDRASVDLEGAPGLRFRIYPLPRDGRTFVLAEAPLAEIPAGRRGPRIRTLLTLGEQSWPIELELVPRVDGAAPLTLGQSAFSGGLAVDAGVEATVGSPRLWPAPAGPGER